MFGYIYLTTNTINNMIYIGQHKSNVFDSHYKGSGTLIREAFKKYGKENFKVELLEECFTQEEMDFKERYYESIYGLPNFSIGYNITKGGQDKTFSGCKHSKETKNKMSLSKIGKTFSKEHCKSISKNKKGYKYKEEQCLNISKGLKEHYKENPINIGYHTGYKLLEESKHKISEWHKGRTLSEETKLKMSQAHKGKKHMPHKKHNYPKNRKSHKLNKINPSNSGEVQLNIIG